MGENGRQLLNNSSERRGGSTLLVNPVRFFSHQSYAMPQMHRVVFCNMRLSGGRTSKMMPPGQCELKFTANYVICSSIAFGKAF